MNPQDLLDYHLGQMDDRRRDQVEHDLARMPDLGQTSLQLGANLSILLDDGQNSLDPPAGLADRTIALVDQQRKKKGLSDFGPVRVPFRWADVAVAAGIFLAGLLTLLPAMHRTRSDMRQMSCMYNLQQLGLGLAAYASAHGHYPNPPGGYPAGYYGVQLVDAHHVHDPSVLSCPCRGLSHEPVKAIPHAEEFGSLMDRSPSYCQHMLGDGYAYNAGFHRAAGRIAPVPANLAATAPLPLLADQPPLDDFSEVLDGNSPDHGGGGQNVLFTDSSVRWLRSRAYAPDDDIYLNQRRQPAPGMHIRDVSLIPSGFTIPEE